MACPDPSSLSNTSLLVQTHLSLDLDVDFDARVVRGTAEITLRATAEGASQRVSEAWLDTRALDVTSASASSPSSSPRGSAAAAAAAAATTGDDNEEREKEKEKGEQSSCPSAAFTLDPSHPVLGSRLRVPLPTPLTVEGEAATVSVSFSTTDAGSALQWLSPEMTANKEHPFLFSQCQAIHARSFVPCQDTPGAKATYDARVTVPRELTPRMSALDVGAAVDVDDDDVDGGGDGEENKTKKKKRRFSFEQPVPLSPYLLALAVGDLRRRDLSERCAVWAEPSVVDAAAAEFKEADDFLAAVEAASFLPFRWRRADLLVLPKSFPYGGMESLPTVFVTPTLVVGDGSQAGVIAHELCHSVFGNDVSCATWSDFWLNEGFTVWLERRVVTRVRGVKEAALSAASGLAALKESVRSFGEDHPFTRLVPLLPEGADPDDAFSKVPYEKGYFFLKYLEKLVDGDGDASKKKKKKKDEDDDENENDGNENDNGDDGEFARWVSEKWVAPRVGAAATTDEFKAAFLAEFGDKRPEIASKIDWDAWLHSPGMPPVDDVSAPSELGDAAEALARRWSSAADGSGGDEISGSVSGGIPEGASAADVAGWPAGQVTFFLEALSELRAVAVRPLPAPAAAALGELYGFLKGGGKEGDENGENDDDKPAGAGVVGGCEVLCEYLCLALASGHAPAVPAASRLLQKVGRMKYARPLFRALSRADAAAARAAFERARPGLHPICAKMVASDLEVVAVAVGGAEEKKEEEKKEEEGGEA